MIDIVNYHVYGVPVFIYTMMFMTAGALTYATVKSGAPSKGPLAAPAAAAGPASTAPAPAAAAPAPPTPAPQGGRRKTKHNLRKKNTSSTSKKHHKK